MAATEVALYLVIGSILLSFIRLAKGPRLPDRVIALDMMTVSIVAFCALYSIISGQSVFLDVAIVLALIGFLTTLALARFGERRTARRNRDHPSDATEQIEEVAEQPMEEDE
ncbi:pH regulation protein F [Qingshengfaniella alkalisoli]|uniref:pH regulation protein F n=2 Tax=Qingshengfaniella alkalisoli TaxID=2599296 RepID=A0A5B8J786_9RHOB|nr:pH regulation protein F [Qingshengfaniella alkalisoli]